MEKFLVIDGNSIMNRAFYGIPLRSMSLQNGLYTNAIYGFLNTYLMIDDMIKPDYVAVAFDLKAKTFRHEMYEDYKGTRKGMPEELVPQMSIIKDVLKAMNIKILELETYEADDILGTISKMSESKNIHTYILTGDRDSFQLISDMTTVVMPITKTGKTDYLFYNIELLKENYSITPKQVIDLKALMGDSSDNIPGVKGIGEKTATDLILKYDTLDNIYANIDNLESTPKIIEKLRNDKDMAYLSYELAKINKDVPIDIAEYDKCRKQDVNLESLYAIFNKLKFNKLMTRFDFSKISTENIDLYNLKDTSDNFSDKLIGLKQNISKKLNIVYIDDTNLQIFYDILSKGIDITYLLNISNIDYFTTTLKINRDFLAIYNDNAVYILKLDMIKNKNECMRSFFESKCIKNGYNIKQDIRYAFDININNINGFEYDLMIAYYIIDSSNKGKYQFESLLDILFSESFKEEPTQSQISFFDEDSLNSDVPRAYLSDIEIENISKYLLAILESKSVILNELSKNEAYNLFKDIEMPLCETLASMEHVGMYIDRQKLDEFDIELNKKLEDLENNIYTVAGTTFNINSTKQLSSVLFDKLNLPIVRKNKSGYSTDKEVLEQLQDKHEIIPLILEYRQVAKLKSTYIDGLKDKIKEDGRIHTTFMQTVTSTGRLSSIEPNLQNIPIRQELGGRIRKFFVGKDDNLLLDSDYSQIELRVLAHMSEDKLMIYAFNKGIDIHSSTASQVFNIPIDEVTSEYRRKAKAVNFGIVYGISEFGLAKNTGSSRFEAKNYIDSYLNKYSGINEFMARCIQDAKTKGYITTLYNRRRYIEEISSKNKNIEKFGERVAMNAPIQGTAADIIKIAMNNVYKDIKQNNLKSKLIMQVHDELIVEIIDEEEEKIKEIVKQAMENVIKLKVPLDIDMHVAKNWYDAK